MRFAFLPGLVALSFLPSTALAQCEFDRLLAPDAQLGDGLGRSVDVFGDTAFLGAAWVDDQGESSGAVYVAERSATGWQIVDELQASDGTAGTGFGLSVSIDGDRALIGSVGAVYVFERTAGGWAEVAKIVASSAQPGDLFGRRVALDGDLAAIGSPYDHNGGLPDRGSVYVFEARPSGWTQISHLVPADGGAEDNFGFDVALSGDVLVAGSPRHQGSGAVYVYERGANTWGAPNKLMGSGGAPSALGTNVDADGDLVIASSGETTGPSAYGAAYLFARTPAGWVQETRLTSTTPLGYGYAWDVALSGDRAVVGGFLNGVSGTQAGRIYVYQRVGSAWRLEHLFRSEHTTSAGEFARRIAVSGDTVLSGSYHGGTVCNPYNCSSGAAYVFSLPLDSSSITCAATPNSTGEPAALIVAGCTEVGRNQLALRASPVPSGTTGVFYYGPLEIGPLPFGNGVRCVGGRVFRLPMTMADGTELAAPVDLNTPPQAAGRITAGSTWYFQATFRDLAAGGAGFDTSEARSAVFSN